MPAAKVAGKFAMGVRVYLTFGFMTERPDGTKTFEWANSTFPKADRFEITAGLLTVYDDEVVLGMFPLENTAAIIPLTERVQ